MNSRRDLLRAAGALAASAVLCPDAAFATPSIQAPRAKKIPRRIEQLGRVRVDDYAWMRDPNWSNVLRNPAALRPDIRAHLLAENAYSDSMLRATEPAQAALFESMKSRLAPTDTALPVTDGPWEYFERFAPGAQHPEFLRRRIGRAEAELLFDAQARSRDSSYLRVYRTEHSRDHSLFAWTEDTQGAEFFRLQVKDLSTGRLMPAPPEQCSAHFTLSPDSQWIFWIWRNEHGHATRVYRRPARGGADVLVYEERDPGFNLSITRTASNAFIVIRAANDAMDESWLIPATDPIAAPVVVQPRTPGLQYRVEHWNGKLIVLTDADGALDYKLMTTDVSSPARQYWREWIPARPGTMILDVLVLRDWLVRLERVDASVRLVIRGLGEEPERLIEFDEDCFTLAVEPGLDYAASVLRVVYQSPTTPPQWFDCDLGTGARVLRKSQEVPGGYDRSRYSAKRLFAKAADGEQVPITFISKADAPRDGSVPTLIVGYGAYGSTMEPTFDVAALTLVDRGWAVALAHTRGGTEKGTAWHRAGRHLHKKNTFSDFVACAEHLRQQRFSGSLVAQGGSAGGLLMGAIANLRPDLFTAVIAQVPFMDILNTQSDLSLPLTQPEIPEWGNPAAVSADYDYIASYAPYENIASKPYPTVLATASISDRRVPYWEAAKWVARLRERSTSGRPVLLRMRMESGGHGLAGRFGELQEMAFLYAFAEWAIRR
ncbi:S9 family peptidase [Steroidobacter sp.]|uniref:S9 family peptidase n=1 Tax=Steroidobacter sp. TaxID=1978227 RepID=UPI001A3DEEAE|nr:S9 family peptidase [Steroidobacter sp.]MBL8271730.1 S9 family peptidase [Steroidobacter sp.]